MDYTNRREAFRMPFNAEVFCHDANKELLCYGKLINISGLGIYVTTSDRPSIDTPCECEIVLTGQASRLIMDKIRAVVVRHDQEGLALRLKDRLEWIALIPILFHKGNNI